MTVYLDTNVFMYAILDPGKKGKEAEKVLRKVSARRLGAVTSALTFDELFWNVKKRKGMEEAIKNTEAFLQIPSVKLLAASAQVMNEALQLIKKYSLGPRDAIHAASALLNGVSTIVSEDTDFDRVLELKRLNLASYR